MERQDAPNTLDALPDELVLEVARCLPFADLLRLSHASRRYRSLVSSDPVLWPRAHLWGPLFRHESQVVARATIVYLPRTGDPGLSYCIESRVPLSLVHAVMEHHWRAASSPFPMSSVDNAWLLLRDSVPAARDDDPDSPLHMAYGFLTLRPMRPGGKMDNTGCFRHLVVAFLRPSGPVLPVDDAEASARLSWEFFSSFHGQCISVGNLSIHPPLSVVPQERALRVLATSASLLAPACSESIGAAWRARAGSPLELFRCQRAPPA